MDNSQLVNDKSSLEAAPDISTLDCSESPSLNNSSSFSLLPDDSQAPSSLFVSPVSPPVLGEAVLQGRGRLWCGTGLRVAVGPARAALQSAQLVGTTCPSRRCVISSPAAQTFFRGGGRTAWGESCLVLCVTATPGSPRPGPHGAGRCTYPKKDNPCPTELPSSG